jgi:4-amino-4-deoxy-L-arabinose transferase-like glycosyltransferase
MMVRRVSDRFVAAALAAATIALGATRAGDTAFWLDEAYTAAVVRQSFGGLARLLGHEAGMGPYYLTLWAWERLGDSEWSLRMLSVTGGALALAALYLLAARFIDRRVAAVACVAVLCNPLFLYDLTELRAYSWAMCSVVVSTTLFLRLRAEPTRRRAAMYGADVGIALALVVFSAGVVLAQLCFIGPLITERARRRLLLIAGAVATMLFVPSLPALLTSRQIDWIPHTTMHRLNMQSAVAFGGSNWRACFAIGLVLLTLSLVRRRRRGEADIALEVVLASVVATIGLLLGVSLLKPVFVARYLAGVLPLAALGATAGYVRAGDALVARLRVGHDPRVAVPWILAALSLAGMRGPLFTDSERPEDLRAPGQFLTRFVRPDQAVVFDTAQQATAFSYYWTPSRGVVVAERAAATGLPCRVWWVVRGHADALDPVVGAAPADATVAVYDFVGYTIGDIDGCRVG